MGLWEAFLILIECWLREYYIKQKVVLRVTWPIRQRKARSNLGQLREVEDRTHKTEKRKLEERLKHEQTAPGEGGEEKKAPTGSRLQGGLSFGAERKEEQIDAHVRSLLVWRQEDELMLAGKEIRHQGGGFIVTEK